MRLRTLIGAAEMLRNGITTVQDFLTLVPAEDGAIVDTVLSAYEEAGIRVVFAHRRARPRRPRHRAADAEGPAGSDPQAPRRHRAARPSDELDFIAAQIKRLGMHPDAAA